ncbi:hypothetical protein GQ55_3G197100 [Panicum hallii var. hallii]|uniref:non-specific serine/threonine protein kinase n=1 Tax=Panicum hallii var. hallii TaxID=1504633 RepID=A0A2T7EBB7_9POAL|nr:hypothetical protein GQ55_3G197100 [Panicum hallii var. hallii]
MTMPKRMVAVSWSMLLCLAAAAAVLKARAQLDSIGFISIDCGLPGTANSVDDATKLSYAPDAAFTDAGSNHNISVEYITPTLAKRYLNVRSFPDGARSCYMLRSLVPGLKYTLRAEFKYGNYDGLNRPPVFDLYAGVNFWSRVNASSQKVVVLEAIVVVPEDYVHVCLVNTGSGTPFISALELRPLKSSLYPQVNATQGLVLLSRRNFGPTDDADIVRYPDDPHDRVWLPFVNTARWEAISTSNKVRNLDDSEFAAPSKVMQTAITPRNASGRIEFFWLSEPQPGDPTPGYIVILHFSELQLLAGNAVRQQHLVLNDDLRFWSDYTPPYLLSDTIYSMKPLPRFSRYNFSINATANSTMPPIINAGEIFFVFSTANVGTDYSDVSAITAIKAKYRVKKNWARDPCVTNNLTWDGLTCSYANSNPSRITRINMSFSGLDGDISSSFANLKAIQYLDLSYNNLTGSIPDALSQLPSLLVLDLTNNQLSGSIPPSLLKRIQDGSLNIRYGNNPNLCTNAASCKPAKGRNKLAVYVAVPVVLVVVIVSALVFPFLRRKKQGSTSTNITMRPQIETMMSYAPATLPPGDAHTQSSLHLENRKFTYKELEMITNNFQRVLGRGGFGEVYNGFLEDGTQVAIKLRSQFSNQGVKEFLIEAQILTRIHHKNLVSMIGYCKDGQYMALVYEYMSEGTLQEQIAGNGRNGKLLTWKQRLRIAVDSAQELVTGRQAILCDPEPTSIIQWVRRRLARGNIEAVVDKRMRGEYDVNSVWKVADIALKCTVQASTQRPTMIDVVAQLQECLELEEGHRIGDGTRGSFYSGSSNSDLNLGYNAHAADSQSTDVSQTNTPFEMEHNFGKVPRMDRGPVAR